MPSPIPASTIAGPAAAWRLPPAVDELLLVSGASIAGVLAVIRVIHVLRRHRHRR
ncbi:DUF6332 family protein [Streptomyces cirratus]|uniref:DUF6332 family protein n=1 Tax=Streptomyces cirratus TaxID=68187 RepID=UPI003571194A